MTSYAPLAVDVTGWLIARLTPLLAPTRVGSETPADPDGLLDWVPFVSVERIGGPNDNVILDVPTMAFHCYDTTPKTANQLGYDVIAAVRSLRGSPGNGAIMTIARTLSGPTWAATANTALRHAVVLMQPRIKTTG